jgi:hypothetical protein
LRVRQKEWRISGALEGNKNEKIFRIIVPVLFFNELVDADIRPTAKADTIQNRNTDDKDSSDKNHPTGL